MQKIIYPNLRAELARRRMTVESLAADPRVTESENNKIAGNEATIIRRLQTGNVSIALAMTIKAIVAPEIPLEILFEEEAV